MKRTIENNEIEYNIDLDNKTISLQEKEYEGDIYEYDFPEQITEEVQKKIEEIDKEGDKDNKEKLEEELIDIIMQNVATQEELEGLICDEFDDVYFNYPDRDTDEDFVAEITDNIQIEYGSQQNGATFNNAKTMYNKFLTKEELKEAIKEARKKLNH